MPRDQHSQVSLTMTYIPHNQSLTWSRSDRPLQGNLGRAVSLSLIIVPLPTPRPSKLMDRKIRQSYYKVLLNYQHEYITVLSYKIAQQNVSAKIWSHSGHFTT